MRERSTWNKNKIKTAFDKKADPYTMNQDHKQPAMDEYVIGGPSEFAEDVHTPNEWEQETDNRNEIGMGEFRADTFKSAASYNLLLKKAALCLETAEMMFAGKRIASSSIEDQAVALMSLPDQDLIGTHMRLAQECEQEEEEGQDKQAQDQSDEDEEEGQDKQAQDQSDEDEEEVQQGQAKKAKKAQQQAQQSDEDEEKVQQGQAKKAKKAQQQAQQSDEDEEKVQQGQAKKAQQDVMAQMQQMMAQMQQMVQQVAQQQAPAQVAQQQADDMVVADDDFFGEGDQGEIEMDPFSVDEVQLGDGDDQLRDLFASEQSDEEQSDEEEPAQEQAKQASVRTATRTIGTRPSAGVASIGGTSKVASSEESVLNSLWDMAPDVSKYFR